MIRSGDVLLLVCINLGEGNFLRPRELSGELLVHRRYLFAWPTPVGIDYARVSEYLCFWGGLERVTAGSRNTGAYSLPRRSLTCQGAW